jgi:RHH-type proline utilization regulon transcriptional repressor/proline dehydrogenase/delta 1-pyrroline-5-carboxylate dehydrogenase
MVTANPTVIDTEVAEQSYRNWWTRWFGATHDPTGLASERNDLRYRPLGGVLVRIGPDTPAGALIAARRAAELCGTRVVVSDAASEPEGALVERLGAVAVERIRLLTTASDVLRGGCRAFAIEVDSEPISISGRRELRRWLREQAISRTMHRHGRVAP